MECWLTVLIVILCIVALFVIYMIFLKPTIAWDRSPTCLVGKTVMVTGANAGIGFYTAQDFARRGARVILACRNPKRAEDAKKKIVQASGNTNVIVRIIDLGSLESVRQFAKEIITTEERLDILVNNAGAGGFDHTITKDGLSLSMQTNHFGPFLLTLLLIGLIKKSAPSRIVNLGSDSAHFGKLNLEDLNAPVGGIFAKARDYANSKLCNVLFTTELARKLHGSGVQVNSVNPGAVQTDIFNNLTSCYRRMAKGIAKIFYKPTEAGAQTSIYVSVSKEIDGISGQYFTDCEQGGWIPKATRDEELAKKVWEKSEELVKLTLEERQLL